MPKLGEPAWDYVDRAIINAWGELCEQRCPDCGRPLYLHKTQTPADYHVATLTCPAAQQLDIFKARETRRNQPTYEKARQVGRNLDAGVTYLTFTQSEGVPVFDWPLP
ncbi:MAG: hypothetical protein LBJ43_00570 [Propionibacteriaceae bacterium]|nr:hypothetical protein [Propionibacteriaceae bacterium]